MHCILCIVSHSVDSMHCIICIVFFSIYCILCIVLYASYYIHHILCILIYALCSMNCIHKVWMTPSGLVLTEQQRGIYVAGSLWQVSCSVFVLPLLPLLNVFIELMRSSLDENIIQNKTFWTKPSCLVCGTWLGETEFGLRKI